MVEDLAMTFLLLTLQNSLGKFFHLVTRDKDKLSKEDLEAARAEIDKKLNSWKCIQMTIAVIGESGSGKSSFINAVRNVWDETSAAAAKVGVKETTKTITAYSHPRHKNLVYYDLPGVNTPSYPKNTYLDQIKVDDYDYFLLLSEGRFSEIDCWLADELVTRKKVFYFVRTKIDQDIRNNSRQKMSRVETLQEIREDLRKYLEAHPGFANTPPEIFLISNHNPFDFDFAKLNQKMIHDAPSSKRNALIATMEAFSLTNIQRKAMKLRGEVPFMALYYHLCRFYKDMFTFSGCEADQENVKQYLREKLESFRSQLGVDDKSTKALKEICGVVLEDLQTDRCETSALLASSDEVLQNFLDLSKVTYYAKAVPVLGALMVYMPEILFTKRILRKLIDICVYEAELLHRKVSEVLTEND